MHNSESPAFVRPAKFVRVVNGDIWQLGKHRLACGDARNPALVRKLLGHARPRLMATDPPYGVGYEPEWRRTLKDSRSIVRVTGKVLNDDRSDRREAWALFPGDIAYVWHAGLHASSVELSLAAADFRVRAQIIWDKGRLIISRGHYHWRHEACWDAVRKLKTANLQGDRKQTTVWQNPTSAQRHRARHAETGRVHAAADPAPHAAGRRCVRSVPRERDHDHRGRNDRPLLLRHRAQSRLLRPDHRVGSSSPGEKPG